jgi:dethiobiotin synthetase
MKGVFVTGTDTAVGKTYAACALIHALRGAGERVFPMKPIAAGAALYQGRWANGDSLALMRAADIADDALDRVTPVLLREPMAPHIAAGREGRTISLDAILAARSRVPPQDFLVVEGVGGFLVPLDKRTDTSDLARAFALPVVLVVGMRLGCLNHALLTARAIADARLPLAGWIANHIDPAMGVPDENVAALRERLAAPLLGRLAFSAAPDPRTAAAALEVAPLRAANAV